MLNAELHHQEPRKDSIASDSSHLAIGSDGRSAARVYQASEVPSARLGQLENEWMTWNKVVNNWPVYRKKKAPWIKVKALDQGEKGRST